MDININTADESSSGDYSPLAPGRYSVTVSGMRDKITKAGTGRYTEVEFTIIDGARAGRRLWHIFNFENPSARAMEVAVDQFRRLALACGVTGTVTSTDVVLDRNLAVEVTVQHGETRNRISNFMPLQNGAQAQPQARPAGAGNAAVAAPAPAAPAADDEIPF